MRTHLNQQVKKVLENFDVISVKAMRDDEKTTFNLSMYAGGGGVLFGLYKYSQLLRKESNNLKPNWLDEMLKVHIDNSLKSNLTEVNSKSVSFYSSQEIGIRVLACLNLLKEDKTKFREVTDLM